MKRARGCVHIPLAHTKTAIAREPHLSLMRFRACTWDFQVNRSYGGVRRREERVCRLCVQARRGEPVEDEMHVLMECPTHQSLRDSYADLPFAEGMQAVMNHPDQKRLATFVTCNLSAT